MILRTQKGTIILTTTHIHFLGLMVIEWEPRSQTSINYVTEQPSILKLNHMGVSIHGGRGSILGSSYFESILGAPDF